MNGIPETYELVLTQSAKGIYYVDKLRVNGSTQDEILKDLDEFVDKVNERLQRLNKTEDKQNGN